MIPNAEQQGQLLIKALDAWLVGKRRNAWISTYPVEVYVRKGPWSSSNGRARYDAAVQVANFSVSEQMQGQGFFKPILNWLESLKGRHYYCSLGVRMIEVDGIVFENVSSEVLARILIQRHHQGWRRYQERVYAASHFCLTF